MTEQQTTGSVEAKETVGTTETENGAVKRKATLALIGSIIGFLALSAAFMSPWIAEAIDPPPQPIDGAAISELATSIGKAIKEGSSIELAPRQKLPSDFIPPIVIGVGLIGAGFGLLSFFMHEPWRFGACAVTLGVGAAIVQWSIMILALIFFLFLLTIILGALGIDL